MTPPPRAAVAFILVTVLLDMLALGLVVPVLPRLVQSMVGGDAATTAEVLGVFGTAWALMQFLFSPVLGALSDRFGRRPVVLLSNLGLGLDYVLMALAPSLPWLLAGRIISGITAASISTSYAYIADISAPEQRARRFGLVSAAFGVGFVLGPALGGLLGAISPRLAFWVAALLSLLNAAYGTFVLPESLAPSRRARFSLARAHPVGALRLLGRSPALLRLASVNFLGQLAHVVLPSTFVIYALHRYHWGARPVGLTLAGAGAGAMLVQGVLVGPLVRRIGERRTLILARACGVAAFTLFGLAPSGLVFVLGIPLLSLWGLGGPSLQGLMSGQVGPAEQGRLQGANASLQGIAGLIGPGLFTLTFARTLQILPGAPFLLAGGLLAGSLGVVLRARPAPDVSPPAGSRPARGGADRTFPLASHGADDPPRSA